MKKNSPPEVGKAHAVNGAFHSAEKSWVIKYNTVIYLQLFLTKAQGGRKTRKTHRDVRQDERGQQLPSLLHLGFLGSAPHPLSPHLVAEVLQRLDTAERTTDHND